MPKLPKLLIAGLVPLFWGCSSAPIHYHTLVPSQPGQGSASNVRVERVGLPPQVDRSQMVVRQGASGLAILETEWWGANLVDEFQNALQDQLGGPASATPRASVRVEVQRFDSVPGNYSLLDATWRLKRSGAQADLTCRTSVQTPADASVEKLVAAHQANVRQLASAIVQASNSGRCPAQ
ncbi:PqiC family protein [Pseudomonas citronellolis]|uniref:PqiC family protein n=1 Tax=Pseudomonas citronellolis TaxID=53408 RepID=UPI0023E37357|nr:PqiC family protein [Pseudomonas citronellolis]MDF3936621.1 PqiC family protein [Pseudomonas citronellolis]